jgi:hypothetical protein
MNSQRVLPVICLHQGCPIRLENAAGTRVRCLHGTIWITVPGEPDDVFLRAGQSYRIPRDGLSLVENVESGSVELEKPVPGGRLNAWLEELTRHLKLAPDR